MQILFLSYLPYIISTILGYLLIDFLFAKTERPSFFTHLFLGTGLGLGISALITFLSFVCFDSLIPIAVIMTNLFIVGILLILFLKNPNRPKQKIPLSDFISVIILIIFSLPLWYQSQFYAFGGWDAWATWNLKAKFLFLGADKWDNMFHPTLWRSSPHYPLLLPCVNVWGWIFLKEPVNTVPIFTSFIFTLLTFGLMFCGLKNLTKTNYALLPALVLLTMPVINKLSLSQYSDNIFGFYLLATLFCVIMTKTRDSVIFAFLAGLFLGLMTFTKGEGLLASLLIGFLTLPFLFLKNPSTNKKKQILLFIISCVIGCIIPAIFYIFYAPENITFINGLESTTKISDSFRLKIILGFSIIEVGAPIWNILVALKVNGLTGFMEEKWMGIWILMTVVTLFNIKRSFNSKTFLFPLFFISYGGVIIFYYWLNTYFEIGWWLQVTLHRLLFAVLPSILFWVFYAAFQEESKLTKV